MVHGRAALRRRQSTFSERFRRIAATWSSYEPVRLVTVSAAGDPGDGVVYSQDLLYVPY